MVGFVHAGQDAEIKVESFNFTRYGLIRGTVVSLSRDAVSDDQSKPQPSPKDAKGEGERTQSGDGSPSYVARIVMKETAITTENGPVALGPGMAVTAEIKTGRRRVISYLLSPLMRYRQEGLRER
jgi:hemolysin D